MFFADMHPVIPFLLLGIGVDDMYIIIQAVEKMGKTYPELLANERIAKAMSHVGASITITSVTDMAAFLIGSTTVSLKQ